MLAQDNIYSTELNRRERDAWLLGGCGCIIRCPFVTHLGRRLFTAALRWVVSWISLRSVRGDNNREGNGYGSQASLNI